MTRQQFLCALFGLAAAPLVVAVRVKALGGEAAQGAPDETIAKLDKSVAEWRRILSGEEYAVLFEEGTERSHSSSLNQEKRPGTFICAACYLPLFDSGTKVRERHRLAQLLGADSGSCRHQAGLPPDLAPHRVSLHQMRWTPGACFQRRAGTNRQAILQQRYRTQVRCRRFSGAPTPHLTMRVAAGY